MKINENDDKDNKIDNLLDNKSDELIDDREEQKKFVHPYRKYQIYIIFMIILMIIFGLKLYDQNQKLKEYLNEKDIALTTLTNVDIETEGIREFYDLVEVNYKYLDKLDEARNIDIIRTPYEIYTLSSFIDQKNVVSYSICYKSSDDGDNSQKFIENCSNLTPLVFLIETVDGYRFGAYITQFLNYQLNEGKGGYIWDPKAFIFSFDTMKKYDIKKPEYAIYVEGKNFPVIGMNDIYIGNHFSSLSSSYSEFPSSYERNMEDKGDYILNGGNKKFTIKELEVLSPSIWESDLF